MMYRRYAVHNFKVVLIFAWFYLDLGKINKIHPSYPPVLSKNIKFFKIKPKRCQYLKQSLTLREDHIYQFLSESNCSNKALQSLLAAKISGSYLVNM